MLNEPSTAAYKYAGERSPTFKIFVLALYSTSTNKTCRQLDVVPAGRKAEASRNARFLQLPAEEFLRLRAIFAPRALVARPLGASPPDLAEICFQFGK